MNRLLVFALVASIGNVSAAFAGESLLASGARHVQQISAAHVVATSASNVAAASPSAPASVGQATAPSYQGSAGNLSKSGLSKGKKAAIYIGLAVGFAAGAWTIDHHVLNVTPSSLGTRLD